jgi:3-oxoacyl-[acyl-carrier-protein] synthase II
MPDRKREAWITGIGMVSTLGEGPQAHWDRLMEAKPGADETTYAPYVVHPVATIDFDKQIPKKGDQRQMELWQRIGTYAAGLALESAGAKGNQQLLGRMDMIVAAAGGERDIVADSAILSGLLRAENPDAFLNERLLSDLRPTLFLAQLSNLLAGNISIVHGVTGSSRTFMGEETAGVDAVRIALARIEAGQSEIVLVGGAHNGERKDIMMQYVFGGMLIRDGFRPIWDRGPSGGCALGSLGAFLVLEERESARARGALPFARLTAVVSDRSARRPGDVGAQLRRIWDHLAGKLDVESTAIISGATGAEPATSEERAFHAGHPGIAVRAPGSYLGLAPEPQFAMNVAIAALTLKHGRLFPPGDVSSVERAMKAPVSQIVITSVGHWRGEGMALIEAIDKGDV